MPRGGLSSIISVGGLPEITALARRMGDYSSVKHAINQMGKIGVFSSKGFIATRAKNRAIGRVAGIAIARPQAYMGLFGLVAVAQGLAIVRKMVEADAARETWVGSLANYSVAVDQGHHDVPPTLFFTNAARQAERTATGSKFGSGFFQKPVFVDSKGRTRFRGGLYESQKFIGDFGALFRGDIVGRVIRRESGRVVAGFFWGTLANPKKNVLSVLGEDIVRRSRRNLRQGGHIATGALYASMASSDEGRNAFIAKSITQMAERLRKTGKGHLLESKVDFNSVGGPF